MTIPEWFIWLQGALTTILVPICGAALKVLWQMRQELTVLNTKIELTRTLQIEVESLWSQLNQVKTEGTIPTRHMAESLHEIKDEISKLRKRYHHFNNVMTVLQNRMKVEVKDEMDSGIG